MDKEYGTLELLFTWGKEQPSGIYKNVKSTISNQSYNMSINGFLYYITTEELNGNWIINK